MTRFGEPADKNLIRRLNIALILSYLRTSAFNTRAALATCTGLTRATVSSLVEELIALNLVRETGLEPSQGGRPGTRLELNPEGGCAVGIEIGVGFVSIVLTDFIARVRWRKRVDVNSIEADTLIPIAEQLVKEALQFGGGQLLKPLGIGLGLPGLVNTREGHLKFAPNLRWEDIPFQANWEGRFNLPVHVANEASVAALGEHYFGAAADYSDFVYLSACAIGLGAGIMIGGKLFQGVDGYAGEVGHMVLDPDGPRCACGRCGCWEKVASAEAIVHDVAERVRSGTPSKVIDMVGGNLEALTLDMVARAAIDGDPVAYATIERVSRLFAIGLINLINTFNPQLIIVGGVLGPALEPFLPMIKTVMAQQAFRGLVDRVDLKISGLGVDACAMGAVAMVLDEVLTDPSWHTSVNSLFGAISRPHHTMPSGVGHRAT